MERISQAVLSKVNEEAHGIISDAEQRAQEEKENARKQYELRFQREERKLLAQAREEAARIMAQASIQSLQELSRAKHGTISETIDRTRRELLDSQSDAIRSLELVKEAVDGLGMGKARIYVSPGEASMVRESLNRDRELADRIVEVREEDLAGGVIAEDIDGRVRIDNTYQARLEVLLPKLLPEIGKELFGER